MQLGLCSISANNTIKSIYFAHFHSVESMEKCWGIILLAVEAYLLYKRKLSQLWVMHNVKLHVEDGLKY
jgi:hypothetical protein